MWALEAPGGVRIELENLDLCILWEGHALLCFQVICISPQSRPYSWKVLKSGCHPPLPLIAMAHSAVSFHPHAFLLHGKINPRVMKCFLGNWDLSKRRLCIWGITLYFPMYVRVREALSRLLLLREFPPPEAPCPLLSIFFLLFVLEPRSRLDQCGLTFSFKPSGIQH